MKPDSLDPFSTLKILEKRIMKLLIVMVLLAVTAVSTNPVSQFSKFKTTADRVKAYGYPVEEHTVQTSDGYILQLFRIPYSPKLKNKDTPNKPVIYLQHGLLSSSDCWILNGPKNALAYLLADAGYDVWMGNARGNTYSRKNASKTPMLPPFWNFTWHEIGIYDLAATIDYILYMTQAKALHYVGHSQGTTAFMLLLSKIPNYNKKIKTSHLLAPVAYMNHMKSPLAVAVAPALGHPSLLSKLIGSNEFMPSNDLLALLGSEACADKSVFQPLCGNVLFLIAGWDSQHLNFTLLPEVMETHPAGSSTSQIIHYLQEYESKYFREYDHGYFSNKKYYNQRSPPEYDVQNISPQVPVQFYYSDNDYMSAVEDVIRMADRMRSNVQLYHIKYSDWNHLDFLWALEVKEIINDRIIRLANDFEKSF